MVTIKIGEDSYPLKYISKNLGGVVGGQLKIEKESGNTFHTAKRLDTEKEVGFGIGTSGKRAGMYSWELSKWLFMEEAGQIMAGAIDVTSVEALLAQLKPQLLELLRAELEG